VSHEIATHSYSHIYFGEVGRSEAEVDLSRAATLHRDLGVPFDSIVFPRNQVAHLDVVAQSGVRVFRSVDAGILKWATDHAPRIRPALNLVDKMVPTPPPTVVPWLHANGLVELPSSMLLIGRNGLRRAALPSVVAMKIRTGLMVAAARRRMFHLWFHPSNFYYETDAEFDILERGLVAAARMRDQGQLDIGTMGDFAHGPPA
jgi:hypothetical protein